MAEHPPYVAPLRAVCIRLVEHAGRVTSAQLADAADCSVSRARAFLTILVNRGALTRDDLACVPGDSWAEWRDWDVKTRPIEPRRPGR